MAEAGLRKRIVAAARRMNALGINQGASGKVSARLGSGAGRGFLITPSAIAYEAMGAGDIVKLSAAGKAAGGRTPSSEWRIHHDIYAARADAGAIVHSHSVQATALACLGRPIPAFHYMVAAAGGDSIRCAPYAVFASQALSDAALEALADRRACLLAHHGVIALGADLDAALGLAVEVETLATQYLAALGAGVPKNLSKKQMAEVLSRFERYHAGRPVEEDGT